MSDNSNSDRDDDSTLGRDAHWKQVAQRPYDPAGNTELSTVIVFAIADAKGVPPDEISSPPLYESVDVAAIETALFGRDGERIVTNGTGSVEFRYTEYLIRVRGNGWVQVHESDESEPT
ncbi:HalOD1 output domain-containing protein [Halorubrum sp. DTA46]|uniref:HalOD1 output domain-containing protein n=1 Tax=Halorubrum sp. DTA46 TaxID=3402162 RepID=UPI003AAA9007